MGRQPLFRFIHCSDLHLDSPFEGIHSVEPWVADILRKATFEAFQGVVNTAIQKSVILSSFQETYTTVSIAASMPNFDFEKC